MIYIKMFEDYTADDRMDQLLDKIHKHGITAITADEKRFLDAYKSNNQDKIHSELLNTARTIFEDSSGQFKYQHKETIFFDDMIKYEGILYVPDLVFDDGTKVSGKLEGSIILYPNYQITPDFEKEDYDVFEFCNGLEHELYNFLDYIVSELNPDYA